MLRQRTTLVFGALLAVRCGAAEEQAAKKTVSDLSITIASPAEGAADVRVTGPELRAVINRPLLHPDLLEVVVLEDTPSLFVESKAYYGDRKYSATALDISFQPFNIFQSQRSYTFLVRAEGIEASAGFTTEVANEGPLPPVSGRTFDFRLKELTYPKELASVFNAQLTTAPPILMHIVKTDPADSAGRTQHGNLLVVSATGKVGDAMGESAVLPEDEAHRTTTAVAIEGRVEGTWFGAGPSDLHTTASGVPLVIRSLYVTGLFNADGTEMSDVSLTGVIDPDELGQALDLELDFLCREDPFKKHCDEDGRLRMAAKVEAVVNDAMPFTTFVTKPVNASVGVDPEAPIEVFFSEEVDLASTTIQVEADDGGAVMGTLSGGDKGASYAFAQPLSPATRYSVEVRGVAKSGAIDVRHAVFTTR